MAFANIISAFDNPAYHWRSIVTTLLIGKYTFETYVSYRQYKEQCKTEPPASIKNEITKETFDKSQEYSRANSSFAFVKSTFNLVKDLAYIKFDLYQKLWSWSGSLLSSLSQVSVIGRFFGSGIISQSLVLFVLTSILGTLERLPFSYYADFVLEEKFGFNKSTVKLWALDTIKLSLASLVLGTPAVYGFLKIIDHFGTSFISYACAFTLLLQLILMTIMPKLILPLFYKLTPIDDGELKKEIEQLATKNGFPLSGVYVIDGSSRSGHSNAFLHGLPWSQQIVLFDTLIDHSTTEEIIAVLAHEIGHWNLNHIPQLLVTNQASVILTCVLYCAFMENKSFFHSFGFFHEYPPMIAFLLFSYVNAPIDCVVQFVTNFVTRKNEYQADNYAKAQGYSEELASALIKLEVENLSSFNVDWLYSTYKESHPTLVERLNALGYISKEKAEQPQVN
ncbi:putative zinc metalloprotease [Clavispora lusitaniae]|uniref:CAAX prenyl protease n=1 Tax=Clavispora lusitaniae TaxID=36911 RepID=A0AA91T068_CLALS|nr:putative zinc metalloprotease [Clavispora lusitaniae]